MAAATDYAVPFVANLPDNMHCAQAILLSVRAYFEPDLDIGFEVVDKAISNPRGTGTWRMAGMMWMHEAGYEVHNVEMLDYEAFSKRGLEYVKEYSGEEVAAWEAIYFDIPIEQERAKRFVKMIDTVKRVPKVGDIQEFLLKGYLVNVTVNANMLNGKPGYLGHAVLVKGFDGRHVIVHDPGSPPKPNRCISWDVFESAWANGYPDAKTLTAYRKAGNTR